jgi:surface protein
MFHDAPSFQGGDLTGWNTSRVVSMYSMFEGVTAFSGDVSTWDVSNVEHLEYLVHVSWVLRFRWRLVGLEYKQRSSNGSNVFGSQRIQCQAGTPAS